MIRKVSGGTMSKPNNLESLWMPFTPNKTFKKILELLSVPKICTLSVMIIVRF